MKLRNISIKTSNDKTNKICTYIKYYNNKVIIEQP